MEIVGSAVAVVALLLSLWNFFEQRARGRRAHVAVWFTSRSRGDGRASSITQCIVSNSGPATAHDIDVIFTDREGQIWQPYWATREHAPFPVPVLDPGERIHAVYHHIVGHPVHVQADILWRDGRRGRQRRQTWTGQRWES